MGDKGQRWFEVWADGSIEPPYLLLVRPDPEESNSVLIHDPKESYSVVYRASDYDSARMWLLEDEYTLLKGRTFLDLD